MSTKQAKPDFNEWNTSTQLTGGNSAYLDSIYESYLDNPNNVDESWKNYFDSIQNGQHDISHEQVKRDFVELTKQHVRGQVILNQNASATSSPTGNFPDGGDKISAVMDLIYTYRYVGHKQAKTDPLNINNNHHVKELDLDFHGLTESALEESFSAGEITHNKSVPLKDIIRRLKETYCGSMGTEYMHLSDMAEKLWIRQRLEAKQAPVSADLQKWLLDRLSAAESLEKYLGMKYVGQKRFSLEGGESLIPLMDKVIDKCAQYKVREAVIGMAHRGRLNVLVNIMGKTPESLFKEFEGSQDKVLLAGDVKYHQGFSSNAQTENGDVHLSLAFNPSHLEVANSVVVGSARARQERRSKNFDSVLPIQMHGDSAFCGQGIVMETLALSQTRHYGTGGSLHIVINNQVGFTTNNPNDVRSSLYCTDIAKMIEAPIIHVNGDDPEAVIRATELAIDYRMSFKKDVVIDLVCYRRHGHNEADEPSGTQPIMYSVIKKLPTTRTLYAKKLIEQKVITDNDSTELMKSYRSKLDKGSCIANVTTDLLSSNDNHLVNWKPYIDTNWSDDHPTSVDEDWLKNIARQMCTYPETFVPQKQVAKAYDERVKMANGEVDANWGFAETLAYATLLAEGHNIRVSGEDCGRGTFSHRHAVLHNSDVSNKDLRTYIPLQHINENARCDIIDSVLSEYGVLGFDYGYSCSSPESLVIWEAQFGDFANTAQVVIDQFICSAEEKWGRLCGLTMLLPHGQEGMGAEHSSARLERYLQLCANDNMQVCVPTTPSQIYHMLRRQVVRPYRKPLIVMSPKSLLRHPLVHSSITELANGKFECIIDEIDDLNTNEVDRVVVCCGKVYYDLLTKRRDENIKNVAIVRAEQLYPFPEKAYAEISSKYSHVKDIVWCQEEPENQGAWWMIQHELKKFLTDSQTLSYAGRKPAAAPAVGYPSLFHKQQESLVLNALNIKNT